MNDMSPQGNTAFQDYATSGAFAITLTRNQVSCLAMGTYDARLAFGSTALQSLMRKGLLEKFPANPEDFHGDELRPTHAGLLVSKLCQMAGLTNGGDDPVAVELADMRAELLAARESITKAQEEARQAWADNRSLIARLQSAQWDLANARSRIQALMQPSNSDEPFQADVRVILRDPQPGRSLDAIADDAGLPT